MTAGMRGYAKFDATAVAAVDQETVPALLGKGHFAVTVDQENQGAAYQGLVELEGDRLTDCIHQYFRQSEQVKTGMKIAVELLDDGAGTAFWRAGAVMVQCLPEDELDSREKEVLEDWRRTMMLLGTVKDAELLDPGLSPERLLLRLFHEEGVRIFDPQPLNFRCRCNRERVETLLRRFKPEDIASMQQENGGLSVTCEFCNETYEFEEQAVARLLGRQTH